MKVQVKKMSQQAIDNHASLIIKQVKKPRPCIRGCGTTFMSRDAGHRVCDICSRMDRMGILAESVIL